MHRATDALSLYTETKGVRRRPSMLPSLFRSAISLARESSPRLFKVVIALSLASALVLAAQVALGKAAIDGVLEQDDNGKSVAAALPAIVGLVAVTAIGGLLSNAQGLLQRLLGERVQLLMWNRILDVTTAIRLETFEEPRFFDDLERVRTNALIRPITLSQGLVQLTTGVVAMAALGAALAIIDPVLLAVLLVGGLPLWYVTRRGARIEFDFAVRQTPGARLRHYLTETLAGRNEAKEVRAFLLADTLRRRWSESYVAYLDDFRRHIIRRLSLAALSSVVTLVVTSSALAVLLYSVYRGRIALGSAGAALLAIRLLSGQIQQAFAGIGAIFESSLFLRDFDEFSRRKPEVQQTPESLVLVPHFEELRVENVRFAYPGSTAEVLRGVSMRVRAGETVALVGENGSGKTTLAKILAQLYTPTGGAVLWDGREATELNETAVRSRIGVIFQDYLRYQLSARENIAFGRSEAADDTERIKDAAARGGAARFIERFDEGYETGLGKEFTGGQDLSGGQWQRIALARAFFRDADFLVLDEPTAALDARSEAEIFENVRALADGKSLLLISHRFSTVKSADRIYVLHNGEVVEEGTHDELMAAAGRYAELFELQATAYR